MAALCNQAALGHGRINPLTALTLYKSITLPSALYGCELWVQLSSIQKLMLERMQRYCCKLIQGLGRQTRSDICVKMLGLSSIQSHIEGVKMKFFRRITALPTDCTSKEILIRRLFQARLLHSQSSGFAAEIIELLQKYSLTWCLDNFLEECQIPDKFVWKRIVNCSVRDEDKLLYEKSTKDDLDFRRFHCIHPDIHTPNPVWKVAKSNSSMLETCLLVAKIVACPIGVDDILCEFCGKLFKDKVEHYVCLCSRTSEERDGFWDTVNNRLSIDMAGYLYNLEDSDFINILLGGPCGLFQNDESHIEFLKVSYYFLAKLINKIPLMKL